MKKLMTILVVFALCGVAMAQGSSSVSKAPADVVAQERAKLAEAQEKLARVREQMKAY